jgi:hypothetical protein
VAAEPLQALALDRPFKTGGKPEFFGRPGAERLRQIDAAGKVQRGDLPRLRRFLRFPCLEVFGFLAKAVHGVCFPLASMRSG